jgi:type II secretory pathway predicted ATPase ExeA
MVSDFYRFAEQPFGVTPNPSFLYLGKTHREALASVLHGLVSNRGYTALIAGPGMGKTTLLWLLLEKLKATARTAFLSQSQCLPGELLRALLASQGIEESGDSLSEMHRRLNDALVREHKLGKPFVVVIDDAQHLPEPTLELLQALSNLETPSEKLMHFVLAGQPKLAERLASPDLLQLRQRVSIFARLEPFSAEETGAYIDHRLRVARYDFQRPLFTESALALVARNTKGIPRNINNVCFNALSLGFVKKQPTIDIDVIEEVLQDLDLEALIEAGSEVSVALKSAVREGEAPAERPDRNRSVSPFPSPRTVDLRRSSRIAYPVSLMVLGTDRSGQNFEEKTSADTLNLHGCRYSSRRDYPIGQWVTLQITGTDGDHSSARACVRSVFTSASPRELCQVGVEFEQPANVWGIPTPPADWGSVYPSLSPVPGPNQGRPEGETTVGKAGSPSLALDELLPALQGRLQQAADRAAQAAIESRLEEAVKKALAEINETSKTGLRQTEELTRSRAAELQGRWEKELVAYRSREEETGRRMESLAAKAGQGLLGLQKFVGQIKTEAESQLHTCLTEALARAKTELEAMAAKVSERLQAQLEKAVEAKIPKARSYPAASPTSTSAEHLESLVDSSRAHVLDHIEQRLSDMGSRFEKQQHLASQRADDLAKQLEKLTVKLHRVETKQDQSAAEVRSLLATSSSGLSRERLDSVMHSVTGRIFDHLERRLSETSSRFDQQQEAARQSYEEMTRRVEQLATETRTEAGQTRELAERSYNFGRVQQSADRVVSEIENLAARVSDRQLIRMTEQRQALASELSLELEARASETRAHLEKAANSAVEQVRRRIEQQIEPTIAEATEHLGSTLASLNVEYAAAREARRRTIETEVARVVEQSKREFHSTIKVFLHSCLLAAVEAVDEHAQQTLAALARPEVPASSSTQDTTQNKSLSSSADASLSTSSPQGC